MVTQNTPISGRQNGNHNKTAPDMGAARNINYLTNMKTVRNYTVGMPNSFILSCNIVR